MKRFVIVKQSKYKNKHCVYKDVVFHSKKEAAYAIELDLRMRGKDIKSWRRQEKIELRVNDVKICNYYMDFVITHNDGSEEYIEVKGFETNIWKMKWKLLQATKMVEHPEIKFTIVR